MGSDKLYAAKRRMTPAVAVQAAKQRAARGVTVHQLLSLKICLFGKHTRISTAKGPSRVIRPPGWSVA